MKKFLIIITFCLTSTVCFHTYSQNIDPQYNAAVKELLEASNGYESTRLMIEQMKTTYLNVFPNIPENVMIELFQKMESRLMEKQVSLTTSVYVNHFTLSDIKELVAFYKSPIGRKYAKEIPTVTQELYQKGAQLGQEVANEFMNDLRERGY